MQTVGAVSQDVYNVLNLLWLVASHTAIHLLLTHRGKTQQFARTDIMKEVHQFLGWDRYYHCFWKDFTCIHVVKLLQRLMQKANDFKWISDCKNTFNTHSRLLTMGPMLSFPGCPEPLCPVYECELHWNWSHPLAGQ